LWSEKRITQNGTNGLPDEAARMRWQDRVLFGQTHSDWTEVDHPEFGKVLVGGGTKYSRRTPPPFMLEEEAHRNFAFTMFHASEMPVLRLNEILVTDLGDNVWQVDLEIANDRIIQTRLAHAASKGIGLPDFLSFEPGGGTKVLLAGPATNRFAKTFDPVEFQPARFKVEDGIKGRSISTFRYILASDGPPSGTFQYEATKAADLTIPLEVVVE